MMYHKPDVKHLDASTSVPIPTLDIEMTPSKFNALFLAVNKSSLHPEISSCKHISQNGLSKLKKKNKEKKRKKQIC